MESFRPIYEAAKNAEQAFYDNYLFDDWMIFLVQQGLCESADGICKITEFGKEFLQYVFDLKLPAKDH